MSKQRARRVSEEIKKEVAKIIRDNVKDPRVGFVTITSVDLSGDLSVAKIYFSVMGEQNTIDETVAALESAKGYIRREISQRIKLRHVPEIHFLYDHSIEQGTHIDALLEKIKQGEASE
ncbi:30S ribosome-binding factor RbfA [Clostridia bacterium]|nr:30S ribosome-binding factor RbfA [Clostridia bacterium]